VEVKRNIEINTTQASCHHLGKHRVDNSGASSNFQFVQRYVLNAKVHRVQHFGLMAAARQSSFFLL